MDIDDNQQVTCEELGKFLKSLLNDNDPTITKNVEDKDLRFFMQYMDLDRNQLISKGEFLKYFQKIEALSQRLYPLFRLYEEQSKVATVKGEVLTTEKDARAILSKMQREGIHVKHFINHLPAFVDHTQTFPTSSKSGVELRLIKLGPLLKQFQLSYPTLTLEEIRSLLKWVKVQGGGRYDYLEV